MVLALDMILLDMFLDDMILVDMMILHGWVLGWMLKEEGLENNVNNKRKKYFFARLFLVVNNADNQMKIGINNRMRYIL